MSFCKKDGKVMSINYRNLSCSIIAHIEDCFMAGVIDKSHDVSESCCYSSFILRNQSSLLLFLV